VALICVVEDAAVRTGEGDNLGVETAKERETKSKREINKEREKFFGSAVP